MGYRSHKNARRELKYLQSSSWGLDAMPSSSHNLGLRPDILSQSGDLMAEYRKKRYAYELGLLLAGHDLPSFIGHCVDRPDPPSWDIIRT